jgi:hypothetical protein
MLLADWFAHLARAGGLDLTQYGTSGQAFTVGAMNAFHVTAHFTESPPFLDFVASDTSRQDDVNAIVAKAIDHVERRNLGDIVWYSTGLHEVEFKPATFSLMGSLLQRLGSQTRIAGWRRLGTNVLLEFVEDVPDGWAEKKPILAPRATVHVHVAAPGPCAGHFSAHVTQGVVETAGAICTFALGRPVELPPSVFPSKAEALQQLVERRTDREIPTLARKGVSLDIFGPLGNPGGRELFQRVRAAVTTFDAALRQERDSVACILYVVAAECLAMPYTEWRRTKLTKRFVEFFDELMPTDLDGIVAHGNFEEAFGIRRGTRTVRPLRREFLDWMYDYRSGQLHEGLSPGYQGLGVGFDASSATRRGLLADFAEAAILRYLAAPRVSLIGHPGSDERGHEHAPARTGT